MNKANRPAPTGAARLDRKRHRHTSSSLWLLFALLVLLQALDLLTTYLAVAGGAREGNPMLRGLMFTPIAPVLKALALVFLAVLIVRSVNRGRPLPARLLATTRLIVLIYLVVVANNALLILRTR